jgi:hypothetical protein
MTRRTFAERMAAAGLDFAAIGVEPPAGVTLPLPVSPDPEPAQAPALEPEQTVTCGDYRAHQFRHRRTPAGWQCELCEVLPW